MSIEHVERLRFIGIKCARQLPAVQKNENVGFRCKNCFVWIFLCFHVVYWWQKRLQQLQLPEF